MFPNNFHTRTITDERLQRQIVTQPKPQRLCQESYTLIPPSGKPLQSQVTLDFHPDRPFKPYPYYLSWVNPPIVLSPRNPPIFETAYTPYPPIDYIQRQQQLSRSNTPKYHDGDLNNSAPRSPRNPCKSPTYRSLNLRQKKDDQEIQILKKSRKENDKLIKSIISKQYSGDLFRCLDHAMRRFDQKKFSPEVFKSIIDHLVERALKNNNASSPSRSDVGELFSRPSFKGKTLLLFTIENEICPIIKLILALVKEQNVLPSSYETAFFGQKTHDGVTPVCLAQNIDNKEILNALVDAGFSNAGSVVVVSSSLPPVILYSHGTLNPL